MTDKELRDAAVAELKLTTAGWRKSNGNANYPSGTAPATTHWGKAMKSLEQIGQTATPGNVVELPSSVTPAAFTAAVNGAPAGPLTVRPSGASFTTDDVVLRRAQVRIERGTFRTLDFDKDSSGSSLVSSHARSAHMFGADGITWEHSTFDGERVVAQCYLMPWPKFVWPPVKGVTNFRILDCDFQNYNVGMLATDPHSEALFIGGLTVDGLIANSVFRDNGSTAHIFFSYFGGALSQYPRDICVKTNRFERHVIGNTAYAIQHREEIPASSNICIDPDNVLVNLPHLMGNQTGPSPEFVRAC